ncbi:MAG: hypothetical protein CVV10_08715 [Gammaproteobacteria bacterium HGW-Gammaproteobacteria-14]|nr:MAG: hypothetical protein CVV10_08715 [Gammaproteobacteria bacterium HGW-Gammaproteobacteria-14]
MSCNPHAKVAEVTYAAFVARNLCAVTVQSGVRRCQKALMVVKADVNPDVKALGGALLLRSRFEGRTGLERWSYSEAP